MTRSADDGSIITRAQALTMIQGFQKSAAFQGIKGGFYGRNNLLKILNQPNCVGIRYYYGKNDKNEPVIVLVGEDNKGKCMSDDVVLELWPYCPPWCPESNALDAKPA